MRGTKFTLGRDLRVIFFGHSGLRKTAVLEKLAQYVGQRLRSLGVDEPPEKLVRVYDAQHYLDMPAFLPAWPDQKAQLISKSLSRVMDDIAKDVPKIAFLSVHLTYFYNTGFSSLTGLPLFEGQDLVEKIRKGFRPDLSFTLIGDIYHAWSEIKRTYGVTLRDLLVWRNLEIIHADNFMRTLLARKTKSNILASGYPYEYSPVIAVLQPPATIFRYLFEPEKLRIYASFPISKSRELPAHCEEINEFRTALHENFTVFDPVTIDELPLENLLSTAGKEDQLTLQSSSLWRLPKDWGMSPWERSDVSGLPRRQIEEIVTSPSAGLRSPLRQQVEERDFRLIDQADCVVTYRPMFGGGSEYSRGTAAEMWYAQAHAKRRLMVHDKGDGDLPRTMFVPSAPPDLFAEANLSDQKSRQKVFERIIEHLHDNQGRISASRPLRPSPLAPAD